MACENGSFKLLTGLLIGAAAGAVAGILLAPRSGKDTRQKLMDEADKLKNEWEKYSSDFSERACQIKNDLESRLREITGKLHGTAEEAKSEASNAKGDLKKNLGA